MKATRPLTFYVVLAICLACLGLVVLVSAIRPAASWIGAALLLTGVVRLAWSFVKK